MLHSNAKTPEEMRNQIVDWLNYNASVKRSEANIAESKTVAKAANIAAKTYEDAAKSIEAIVIEN